MRHVPGSLIAAVLTTLTISAPLGHAQAPTLQEQLTAQYKLVRMGSDSSGVSVVEPGQLLAIQKGGILGVPYSDQNVLNNHYEGGVLKSPNNLMSKGIGFGMKKFGKEQTTHLLQKNDKVYPTKIDVNLQKDTVSFGIVECDTCNKTDPPTYYKATVVFQFAKGTLAGMAVGPVEDTIGQVFALSNDDQQGGGNGDNNNQGGNDQQQGNAQNGQGGGDQQQAQGGDQQQQADPQTIEKGMTPDQVTQALGKPNKIVNLGAKQLYIYQDMKVTFLNGKVTDVQ
jgi:hypothetical protein